LIVDEPRPSVILAAKLPDTALSRLEAACRVTAVDPAQAGAANAAALPEAEGIIVSSMRLDAGFFEAAPKLRVVSTVSVGVDHIDLAAAARHGVVVTITPVLSDAVADLVLGLVIMLARRLPDSARLAASGHWRDAPLGHDLAGKRVLLVGFGRIGHEVARRLLASKMAVAYFDERAAPVPMEGVTRESDLLSALGSADFVSLHVDLNPNTHHLIGAAELAAMKPTAFLINTARGAVVDQTALRTALSEGRIAGAGLDVLEEEPPPLTEPLLHERRAIVLPHIGSATVETRTAMAELGVDNLLACLRGQACPNVVPAP
jgi:lactate dehydrogenase-like 2-hydroxyacid dehydrogenase